MTSSPIQPGSAFGPSLTIGLLLVPLVCLLGGLLYGALGPLLPFIIFKVLIAVLALMMCGAIVGARKRGAFSAIVLGLIGGVAGVAGLWFGWLWQKFGLSDAVVLFRAGPTFLYHYLVDLSADYSYSTSRRGTTLDGGAGLTAVIWIGETVLFALTPLVGGLFGSQVSDWAEQDLT